MSTLTCLLMITLLSGCATSDKVWYRPNTSKTQMQQDLSQVTYETSKASSSYNNNSDDAEDIITSSLDDMFHSDDAVKQGMKAKGYKLIDPSKVPTDASGYRTK